MPKNKKRLWSFTKMVKRGVTYGKKKGHDLVAAFGDLQLDTPKKENRPALALTTANAPPSLSAKAAGKQREESIKDDDDSTAPLLPLRSHTSESQPDDVGEVEDVEHPRPIFDPNNEITALTSLACVEPDIKNFDEYHELLATYFNITKIAQGSFASVLRMELTGSSDEYTIWKLMPLKPRKGKGSRRPDQTIIEDAAAEVKALACMQEMHGFVDFRSARVLRGPLPESLIDLNGEWDKAHPYDASNVTYSADQLWLLIEMSDAGTDLETVLKTGFPDGSLLNKQESGSRLTIKQTWDIFWGVAEALASGEAAAKFEHRDLHPGNVCITMSTLHPEDVEHRKPKRYTNIRVTLIDYTLSRATIDEGEILANSMRDQSLFTQTSSDPVDARQFNTYRRMRDAVVGTGVGPAQATEKWKEFVPMTNVFWLYHILQLLLDETELYGQGIKAFRDRKERKLAEQLTTILTHVDADNPDQWSYLSATEVVEDQLGRFRGPFKPTMEGDGEIMKQQREKRATLEIGRILTSASI